MSCDFFFSENKPFYLLRPWYACIYFSNSIWFSSNGMKNGTFEVDDWHWIRNFSIRLTSQSQSLKAVIKFTQKFFIIHFFFRFLFAICFLRCENIFSRKVKYVSAWVHRKCLNKVHNNTQIWCVCRFYSNTNANAQFKRNTRTKIAKKRKITTCRHCQ